MLAFILATCTILGGIAAVWFFIDKARAVDWEQFRRLRGTAGVHATGRISWPSGQDPIFPDWLRQRVAQSLPDFRLPEGADMTGDWSESGDPATLFPIACSGRFVRMDGEWAVFLLSQRGEGYKVVVFSPVVAGEPLELTSGNGSPQRHFLQTVEPGYYLTAKAKGYDIPEPNIPNVLRLRRQAINYGLFESADFVFYWRPRKRYFEKIPMSD